MIRVRKRSSKRPNITSSMQQVKSSNYPSLSSSSFSSRESSSRASRVEEEDEEEEGAMMIQKRSTSQTAGAGSGGSEENEHGDDYERSVYRSLDAFLEEAVMQSSSLSSSQSFTTTRCSSSLHPWRFWLIFLSLGVANSSDATEILCLSYIISNTDFDITILHETAWRAGILASMVFLGMLLGGLWVGVAGDLQGRRPMLLLGLLTNSISGILSCISVNVWMLAVLRFLSGLGIGATVPPLFTLCSELAPAHDRGFWVSVAASFWMVGSIYVAIVAWIMLSGEGLNWSWRIFALACALPSAAGFVMVYHFVPESPRFLALQGSKRQSQEALGVVHGLARKLHYTGPEWTMEELLHQYPLSSVRQERDNNHHLDEGISVGPITTGAASWKTRVQESAHDFTRSVRLLYTPQLRQTTWPLQMVWFSLSFGSYGLMTWYDTT
jgi:MFS transporter, VNT family, synaptic vesicle glycoprotein 2